MRSAQIFSLYDRLTERPEGLTDGILNGHWHTQLRPAGPHARAKSVLVISGFYAGGDSSARV